MLRFARTHVRWAGVAVQVAGYALGNNPLLWIGTIIFLGSYLWAHCIMEQMWLKLEDNYNDKKEKEESEDNKQD